MKLTPSLRRILFLTLTAVLTAFVLLVNFSGIWGLQTVTLDGELVENWDSIYGLVPGSGILRQPIDSLASALLTEEGIVKVDIEYDIPHGIDVRTNMFTPCCLVLDKNTGKMKGLNEKARVIMLDRLEIDWEQPVLVNLEAGQLYAYCSDSRVRDIVAQLLELRRNNSELFRLIEEIDLGSPGYVSVSLSGLPYRLRVNSTCLAQQLDEFVIFLEQFDPDLENTRLLDLRFDNMILQQRTAG